MCAYFCLFVIIQFTMVACNKGFLSQMSTNGCFIPQEEINSWFVFLLRFCFIVLNEKTMILCASWCTSVFPIPFRFMIQAEAPKPRLVTTSKNNDNMSAWSTSICHCHMVRLMHEVHKEQEWHSSLILHQTVPH